MGVIINYDLDGKHTAVKDAMKAKGYQDYFEYFKTVDGKRVKKKIELPNTTLFHSDKSTKSARDELNGVAKVNGSKVLYILALKFIPGEIEWASYNL
jgi:hypothetical protein